MSRDAQYQQMLRDYGPEVAARYLAISGSIPEPPTQERPTWTRNTIHRPRAFTDYQAALIESRLGAGWSCRDLAAQWGVSQGTISQIGRRQGAYKDI